MTEDKPVKYGRPVLSHNLFASKCFSTYAVLCVHLLRFFWNCYIIIMFSRNVERLIPQTVYIVSNIFITLVDKVPNHKTLVRKLPNLEMTR